MCFRRRKYTKEEDTRIWQYVIDKRKEDTPIAGNKFWRKMQREQVNEIIEIYFIVSVLFCGNTT